MAILTYEPQGITSSYRNIDKACIAARAALNEIMGRKDPMDVLDCLRRVSDAEAIIREECGYISGFQDGFGEAP